MADKGKKKGAGQGGAAKKPAAAAPAEKPAATAPAEKHEEHVDRDEHAAGAHAPDAHAPHAHAPHAHAPHAHAPNIREYFVIFGVLALLTAIEVGVTKVPGINRALMVLALVSLAVTKAAIVGLYYMHLKHETRILKLTVAIPVAAPALYALVLMSEAAWRLTRW